MLNSDAIPLNLPFRWAAATDPGLVRQANEDALVIEPEIGLFVVSDGMGGHRGGDLASGMVVEDIPAMLEIGLDKLAGRDPRPIRKLLRKVIAELNRQVRMEGTSESGHEDMGATIVLALVRNGRAYIANVGDSRIYRWRNGQLRRLSRDHSVIAELIEQGHLHPDHADDHEAQGQITHYMGMPGRAEPFLRSFALRQADVLLLCSDGLTDVVDDKTIARVLSEQQDLAAACQTLIETANHAGGPDNITTVLIQWTPA